MDNAQILTKAITKALANGWHLPSPEFIDWHVDRSGHIVFMGRGGEFTPMSVRDVIYDHDFAKALWGENNFAKVFNERKSMPEIGQFNKGWELSLQEMVIADDAIAYLGEQI